MITKPFALRTIDWERELKNSGFKPKTQTRLLAALNAKNLKQGLASFPEILPEEFDEIQREEVDAVIVGRRRLALQLRTEGSRKYLWLRTMKKAED